MNWRNIKTVWTRELRDQLRDRRTLFMVAVLPLLMYPLMGMTFFQLAQFMRSHTARVLVVGAEQLESLGDLPPLVDGEHFAAGLADPEQLGRMRVIKTPGGAEFSSEDRAATTEQLNSGELDAVVIFPEDFARRLHTLREQLQSYGGTGDEAPVPEAPKPVLRHNSARDGSRLAFLEVERLLDAWRRQIVDRNLAESKVPESAVDPFRLAYEDVASAAAQSAGVWAKLLPFVVFVWALTGAFYPAVDLCAGEKERGTLETLLVSPASRGEIVWGKLLTVITFSLATAVLNLCGIAATGRFITQQMAAAGPLAAEGVGLGMPPLSALAWLVVALPPVAALFSALSFACAAFARSTKEGQYYFMPLFLGAMPLMLMPLSPGVELNLGNSLVPVMGLVLLLRSLIEGNVLEAAPYALPVTVVTFGCCWLATRWAVAQFNKESVLFRGDDRFDLRLWLLNLVRRPAETPTVAMALGCVAMIFLLQFAVVNAVLPRAMSGVEGFAGFATLTLISQAAVIAPALVLALVLVRNRRATFLVDRRPQWSVVAAASALAITLHPPALQLQAWIRELYPVSDAVKDHLKLLAEQLGDAPSPWLLLALLGLLPALVEEFTFRGFVLSGLRKGGSSFWAVVITAVAFGAVHSLLQQSLAAVVVGLLIGYLAVVTRSLWPCVAYHATHNGLAVGTGWIMEELEKMGLGGGILRAPSGEIIGYHHWIAVAGLLLGGAILWWIVARSGGEEAGEATTAASPNRPRPPLGAGLASPETSEG